MKIYYLDNRLVDKKEIPPNARLIKRVIKSNKKKQPSQTEYFYIKPTQKII